MKKIKSLMVIPFLMGTCLLSTKVYGQGGSDQVANPQTLKELTDRSNLLLLSNLVIRKKAIESYSRQSGDLVLNETMFRILMTGMPSMIVGLVTGTIASTIADFRNPERVGSEKAVLKNLMWGTVVSFVAAQYQYEVIRKVELQQLRKLKSMSDEQIIQEYTSVISEINRVSDLLERNLKN